MSRQPDDRSDGALLEAFAGGDESALGELARRYERAMLGYAVGMMRDEGRARDCVQETWVRVIRHAGTFRGTGSVKAWMYRILVHRCRDAVREGRRAHAASIGEAEGADDQVREAEAQDLSARVNASLERLDPVRREVVLLCHHRGMTHREAAAALGVPTGTVKTRLYAAMDELRAMVGVDTPVREVDRG